MSFGLLEGVTVLDLASVGPAARASRWLADYGARIVEGCRAHLSKADLRRLDNRLAPLQGPAALANTAKRPLPATPFE